MAVGGAVLALLLLAGLLTGGWFLLVDGTYEVDPPADTSQDGPGRPALATAAVRDLEEAVRGRDASLAPPGAAYVVRNARRLRVRDFSVRYVDAIGPNPSGPGWLAAADIAWRFGGADTETARTEVALQLVREDGRTRLARIGGGDRASPLWLVEQVRVARAPGVLVLGTAQPERLAQVRDRARRAVTVVRRVLPGWRSPLVVEVPGSTSGLNRALNAPEGEYDTIAAVTATADGLLTPASPVHVFVNPEVYLGLKPVGSQVVMSHEATHVATDAALSDTPLWLLEGFADYVALRDVDLPRERSAAQIIARVREEGPPEELPDSGGFDSGQTHLGASYEAAWLACVELVRAGGEDALVELYRRVEQGAEVDAALREVYGFGTAELTRRWQQRLRELAA